MIEIANAFAQRGHDVDLLVLKPTGQYESHVSPNVRVVSLDRRRMALSFFPLVAYMRREQPSVLIAIDEFTDLLALAARPFAVKRPRIVLRVGNMLSELFERYEGRSKILPFFVRRFFKNADAIVANSHGVADDVASVTGIEPSKVVVIPNPKPRAEIMSRADAPAGHPWLDAKTLPVVLAVGRLRVQKNLELLIRAFAQVAKIIPARLVIVGTGREEQRLRVTVKEVGCEETVSFAGYQENPYAFMSKADLYVACSLWEGLPNALLEALICGLPAIASDCSSGPREILAPDTDYRKRLVLGEGPEFARHGILTPVGDEAVLVSVLKRLLEDSELRACYAEAARERSADFDSQDIIGAYARAAGV